MNNYNKDLDKNKANYIPLSPLTFIERIKDVYPNYEALIYGKRKYTWLDVYKRVIKFASALEKIGIGQGDTVSIMAANTPELFEAHYSIPMTGAVINTINTRLDTKTVAYILKHSDAKVFIVDRQFNKIVKKALEELKKKLLLLILMINKQIYQTIIKLVNMNMNLFCLQAMKTTSGKDQLMSGKLYLLIIPQEQLVNRKVLFIITEVLI